MSVSQNRDHYQILVLGGGTAGITVAAQLRRKPQDYDLAIVEPSTKHYYQLLAIQSLLDAITSEAYR